MKNLVTAAMILPFAASAAEGLASQRQRSEEVQSMVEAGPGTAGATAHFAKLAVPLKQDPLLLRLLGPARCAKLASELPLAELPKLADLIKTAETQGLPTLSYRDELARLGASLSGQGRLNCASLLLQLGAKTEATALVPAETELASIQDAAVFAAWIALCQADGRDALVSRLALAALRLQPDGAAAAKPLLLALINTCRAEGAADWAEYVSCRSADLLELVKIIEETGKASLAENDLPKRLAALANLRAFCAQVPPLADLYVRLWQAHFQQHRSAIAAAAAQVPDRYGRSQPKAQTTTPYAELSNLAPKLDGADPLLRFQYLQCALRQENFDDKSFAELVALRSDFGVDIDQAVSSILEEWMRSIRPAPTSDQFGRSRNTDAIPLTRARQVANLQKLGRTLGACRQNQIQIAPMLQARAFLSCFSTAELMKSEDFLTVFPDPKTLPAEVSLALYQQTMDQIKNEWLNPEKAARLQMFGQTGRNEEDVKAEVSATYVSLGKLLDTLAAANPAAAKLRLAAASVRFDGAEFAHRSELITFEEYTRRRDESFALFAAASKDGLAKGDISASATWFSCLLGASDLSGLSAASIRSLSQIELLKQQIAALPAAQKNAATSQLGAWLSATWDKLKPHTRMPFLEAAEELLGQDDAIKNLNTKLATYRELLQEIKLVAEVDGPAEIGKGKEFGIFLKLRHSAAIEREAKGFARFIEENGPQLSYGQPPVPYRANFNNNIRRALKRQFEVASITWMPAGVRSRPTQDPSWRDTPLAYVRLAATDAAVDRIPSIQIDLDFTDRGMPIVLPVLSSAEIVNAAKAAPRPFAKGEIEMILDDRKLAEGKLILEVRMKGEGLLPDPAELLKTPAEWTWGGKGLSSQRVVTKAESNDTAVIIFSETSGQGEIAWTGPSSRSFAFPKIDHPGFKVSTRRYQDVNLVDCGPKVELATSVQGPRGYAALVVGLAALSLFGFWLFGRRRRPVAISAVSDSSLLPPATPSAINTIAWLRRLAEVNKADTSADIRAIEQASFSAQGGQVDLKAIVAKWSR
ncbi:MAG: hypothetical protein RL095_1373 [Verrucomicrobiota bacterium]|jgi:hypothetical protein